MVHESSTLALASLLSLGLCFGLGACTPVPSKTADKAATDGEPADVCSHVRALASKDGVDQAALEQIERECVAALEDMRVRYSTFTSCVNLAGDTQAVLECEKQLSRPRSLLAAASAGKLEAICDHALGLLRAELGEDAAQMPPDELELLRSRCVDDLAVQLELHGPEQFDRDAACILAARSLQDIEACG
jgi:hypothetical protein